MSGDMGSVSQHSLKDQIEADRYLKANTAAATPAGGLRFVKMVSPGAG